MEALSNAAPAILIGAVLLSIAFAVLIVRRRHLPPAPYRRAQALFSAAEIQFLRALDSALGPSYRIFGKVRVADLAEVLPGLKPKERQAALNRVAYKHFDFVVCSSATLEPLCAVELNDSSHSSSRARRRDQFVAKVCDAITLPLVMIPVARVYDMSELKGRISSALSAPRSK